MGKRDSHPLLPRLCLNPFPPIVELQVLDVLEAMPALAVLYLQGNPLVKRTPHYRKTVVGRLRGLRYLDDRPVFADERARCDAWWAAMQRGEGLAAANAAERAEIDRHRAEEAAKEERNFLAFADLVRRAADEQRSAAAAAGASEQPYGPPDDEEGEGGDDASDAEGVAGRGDLPAPPVAAATAPSGDVSAFSGEPRVPLAETAQARADRSARWDRIVELSEEFRASSCGQGSSSGSSGGGGEEASEAQSGGASASGPSAVAAAVQPEAANEAAQGMGEGAPDAAVSAPPSPPAASVASPAAGENEVSQGGAATAAATAARATVPSARDSCDSASRSSGGASRSSAGVEEEAAGGAAAAGVVSDASGLEARLQVAQVKAAALLAARRSADDSAPAAAAAAPSSSTLLRLITEAQAAGTRPPVPTGAIPQAAASTDVDALD